MHGSELNGQSITLFPSDSLLFSRTNIHTIPPIKYSTDSGFFLYTFSSLYYSNQIECDVTFDCLLILNPIVVLGLIEMKAKQKKHCQRRNGSEKFTISNNINNFEFIHQSNINQFSKKLFSEWPDYAMIILGPKKQMDDQLIKRKVLNQLLIASWMLHCVPLQQIVGNNKGKRNGLPLRGKHPSWGIKLW